MECFVKLKYVSGSKCAFLKWLMRDFHLKTLNELKVNGSEGYGLGSEFQVLGV